MAERSLGVREVPGSIPGSPNQGRRLKKVLFIYGDRPSGHSRAAAALRFALRLLAPRIGAQELGLASDLHPVLGPFFSSVYLECIQKTPGLWDYLYDNAAVASAVSELKDLLSLFHRRKLRDLLRKISPDLIVCTHALPCATLALEKKQGRLKVPLAAVLTDYGVHAYWLSSQVDLYLVPTEEARRELARRGVAPQKIRVTGIPVDPRFARGPSPERSRLRLGLKAGRPTVLVAGGTKGLGPIRDTVSLLLKTVPDCQVIVVCGSNRGLYDGLRSKFRRQARLKVIGFSRRMHECCAAADLLVGKPGGVTAAEAAAAGLPMVLLDPLPGQEQRNAAHLVAAGAAVETADQEELAATVRALLSASPRRLAAFKLAARTAGRPNSAQEGCRELLKLV